MTNSVITWNTHKTEGGFEFRVYTVGYQVPSEILKSGVCRTRAVAVRMAKQWTLYLKAQARRAA